MTDTPSSPAGRLAISLEEMRAQMAAEGMRKGLAGALQAAILGLLECLLALLADFKAGRLTAASRPDGFALPPSPPRPSGEEKGFRAVPRAQSGLCNAVSARCAERAAVAAAGAGAGAEAEERRTDPRFPGPSLSLTGSRDRGGRHNRALDGSRRARTRRCCMMPRSAFAAGGCRSSIKDCSPLALGGRDSRQAAANGGQNAPLSQKIGSCMPSLRATISFRYRN
jgi:hypothetical protein